MSKKAAKKAFAMGRRKRDGLILACLLLAALLISLDHSKLNNLLTSRYGFEDSNSADFERYNAKMFLVTNVVDGDTLDINVPDDEKDYTRIRLWGVDTPETKDPRTGVAFYGPQASEFTTREALDKVVTIYLARNDTRDRYHRLLAYVMLPDKRYLNEALIEEGFGYADFRFKHDYYNKYKQLESAARRQKKGLWKEVTVDKMPQWRQRYEE